MVGMVGMVRKVCMVGMVGKIETKVALLQYGGDRHDYEGAGDLG